MNMLAKLPARRWWYLIPIIFITYSSAYLDHANHGFVAAAGIEHNLGVTQGIVSLVGALFFLGYFFLQVPGAMCAVKHSVCKMTSYSLILWGLYAMAIGFVGNIPTLMATRFIFNVVEAAVMPVMLIYINNWFVKTERSCVNIFLIPGNPVTVLWVSITSGYLIEVQDWHEMFIIESIPAAIWTLCWVVLARDKPTDTDWLSKQEKQVLQQTMDREQYNIKPMRNYDGAMRSHSVIMLCAVHALWSIGVYGLMIQMLPIPRNATRMGIVAVGRLATVPYLAAICPMLTVFWLSDRFQNRRLFIWPSLLVAATAFLASWLLDNRSFRLSYALLAMAATCMYAPYGPFFALIPELLSHNVSGVSMGMISSFGTLEAFLDAWPMGYLNGVIGGPGVSCTFMAIALLVLVVLIYCARTQNETTSPSAEMIMC